MADENSLHTISFFFFQVATANLAWASVAIHQVQVRPWSVFTGLPERRGVWSTSPGDRVGASKSPRAFFVDIKCFPISKMSDLVTYIYLLSALNVFQLILLYF